MKFIPSYRYIRPSGGVTVSPVKPDADYTERSRLIADEGFILTDGEIFTPCIDTDEPEKWHKIEFVPEENEVATEEDYQNALAEFGVDL